MRRRSRRINWGGRRERRKKAIIKAVCTIVAGAIVLFCLAFLIQKGYQKIETKLKIRVASGKEELEKDSVIMAVGDTPVTYQELMVYLYQVKTMYSDKMGEEIWDVKTGDSDTLEDYAHDQILEQILQVKICCEEAKSEGVVLETEEKEEARQLAESMLSQASEEEKETYFLTKKMVQKVFEENLLADKLYDKTVGDVNTVISEGQDAGEAAKEIAKQQDERFRKAFAQWEKKYKVTVSKNLWKQVQL
ncbi:MAG: hypothetical protein PUB10_01380 [Clostridiales bacterium]|nr:hypothetical protein [Clostridiales bacterium]